MSNPSSNNAPGMGVRNVHQSKPIGAIPPKPTPAQLAKKAAPKPAAKQPTKRGK